MGEDDLRSVDEPFDLTGNLFENTPVGVAVVMAREGRYVKVNPGFARIVGRTQEELAGARIKDLTHPADQVLDAESLRKLVSGEIADIRIQKRYVRPDGEVRWVDLTVIPLDNMQGPDATVLGISVDITERKLEAERHPKFRLSDAAESQMATIFSLAALAESRDGESGRHLPSVQRVCALLAQSLRDDPAFERVIDDEFVEQFVRAAPLHDIGKVSISEEILLKPGKLTDEELAIVRGHAEVGAQTLANVREEHPHDPFLIIAAEVARSHHERWDGSGYPDGLAGEWIPLAARIMAVADVYEALRSKRTYKEISGHDEAVRTIWEGSGTQFDPSVVAAFVRVAEQIDRAWTEVE